MRDDRLARQMFYGGCAFLPWLWIVNVLYYRKRVYGPMPLVDYWPGNGRREQAETAIAEGDDQQQPSMMEGLPGVGGDDDQSEFTDGDGSISSDALDMEVAKWVKRSSMSAAAVVSLFVAWIIVFQVNKDSFAPGWFVMSEDEGEKTGW